MSGRSGRRADLARSRQVRPDTGRTHGGFDDHGQRTDQAVRRPDRRRRRLVHPGAGHGHRLPRPERRRQDDDDADDHRAGAGRPPARRWSTGGPTRGCPTRAPSWARCSTPARCTPAGPGGRTCGCSPTRSASRRRGSTRCWRWSGLADAAGRRIRGYSLGMRQRLGIAGALLADPPVLMFDEPANGLDPEGIRWMRDAAARARRPRRHGAAVVAPARRGRAHRRPAAGDRQRPDRGRRAGRRRCWGRTASSVRAFDAGGLAADLARAGYTVTPGADGALVVSGAVAWGRRGGRRRRRPRADRAAAAAARPGGRLLLAHRGLSRSLSSTRPTHPRRFFR